LISFFEIFYEKQNIRKHFHVKYFMQNKCPQIEYFVLVGVIR
jgi:hypothetical protein